MTTKSGKTASFNVQARPGMRVQLETDGGVYDGIIIDADRLACQVKLVAGPEKGIVYTVEYGKIMAYLAAP